jgi:hypothetical protein
MAGPVRRRPRLGACFVATNARRDTTVGRAVGYYGLTDPEASFSLTPNGEGKLDREQFDHWQFRS